MTHLSQRSRSRAEAEETNANLTGVQLIDKLLLGFERMQDPGCALFARKFEHTAANAYETLAAQFLSEGGDEQALRRLLGLGGEAAAHDSHADESHHVELLHWV